jgi:hypothetical protein
VRPGTSWLSASSRTEVGVAVAEILLEPAVGGWARCASRWRCSQHSGGLESLDVIDLLLNVGLQLLAGLGVGSAQQPVAEAGPLGDPVEAARGGLGLGAEPIGAGDGRPDVHDRPRRADELFDRFLRPRLDTGDLGRLVAHRPPEPLGGAGHASGADGSHAGEPDESRDRSTGDVAGGLDTGIVQCRPAHVPGAVAAKLLDGRGGEAGGPLLGRVRVGRLLQLAPDRPDRGARTPGGLPQPDQRPAAGAALPVKIGSEIADAQPTGAEDGRDDDADDDRHRGEG